jgi:hypothetical protein
MARCNGMRKLAMSRHHIPWLAVWRVERLAHWQDRCGASGNAFWMLKEWCWFLVITFAALVVLMSAVQANPLDSPQLSLLDGRRAIAASYPWILLFLCRLGAVLRDEFGEGLKLLLKQGARRLVL